ncbi:mechanosensitive ion channel family protein [Polynucleobacter sp. AP-Elch-400A-B2]|uniref:mechanosensitive ion channel family protein n=1 Tax=Polynucleobacter sp. AP-Elch-400A-B2 TaxID=2576930 RepID=UPI001BFD2C2A|nr:mechanosensitive ion channel family protein [Polynucleobacter sp. AP-Elch-400A-B2]QWE25191.1 mechanosensitive ion channel family protein [Polynucleobacter sp. AP-Elch-400A-B2]
MTNSKHHFLSIKDLVQLGILILLNGAIFIWLQSQYSTIWSWEIVSLQNADSFDAKQYAVLAQLLAFGITIDGLVRILVADINRNNKKIFIPKILIQVFSILVYGLLGLFGAIKLYELPVKSLLAASGVISVILAYAFREIISDILASAQIQISRIARIGDWVSLKHGEETIVAKVIDLDQQIVTLKDTSHTTRLIRNSLFLQQSIINYSTHGNVAVRNAEIELSNRFPHSEIIPILEDSLEYVHYLNHHYHGEYSTRVRTLSQGHMKFILEYRCHPSISLSESNHFVINAAVRFLKSAGFDLTPYQAQKNSNLDLPDKTPHRLLQLKEFGVLKSLNAEETQNLENKARFIRLSPQEILLNQGELKDSIFIVTEGKLSIELSGEDPAKVIKLAKCWPGDVIGEMSLLTGERHTASVIAQSRVILMSIAKSDIEPILRKNPYLTQDIVDQVLLLKQANEKTVHHKPDQTERKNLINRVFQFLGM